MGKLSTQDLRNISQGGAIKHAPPTDKPWSFYQVVAAVFAFVAIVAVLALVVAANGWADTPTAQALPAPASTGIWGIIGGFLAGIGATFAGWFVRKNGLPSDADKAVVTAEKLAPVAEGALTALGQPGAAAVVSEIDSVAQAITASHNASVQAISDTHTATVQALTAPPAIPDTKA